jgi:hypothetical protein
LSAQDRESVLILVAVMDEVYVAATAKPNIPDQRIYGQTLLPDSGI